MYWFITWHIEFAALRVRDQNDRVLVQFDVHEREQAVIDGQHAEQAVVLEIAHLQLHAALLMVRVHLIHQAVQRVEVAAQVRTAHDVSDVVRRHRDRRGRIVTEPDREVGAVGDRLISNGLQVLDVVMVQHTDEAL